MWKKLRLILLIGLGAAVAAEGILLGAVMVTSGKMDDPSPADAMIVLGAGINMDGLPRATLRFRLDRAADLYEQGYAPTVIVTGGQGDDEPMPEAYAMRNYLVERGVPETAILCDPDSYNTKENLVNAQAIMGAKGLNTALIVTSDFHLWRALRIADDLNMTASGTSPQHSHGFHHTLMNSARETLSWIKYAMTR